MCCRDPTIKDIYVGSTTDTIRRKQQHKTVCNNTKSKDHNIYVYRFIRGQGGWENWDMIIIEDYPCTNKTEKLLRERYWIEKLCAVLNKQTPMQTNNEYRAKNKEMIHDRKKRYYRSNKEKINQKQSLKIPCSCGAFYRKSHKQRHFHTDKHVQYVESRQKLDDMCSILLSCTSLEEFCELYKP